SEPCAYTRARSAGLTPVAATAPACKTVRRVRLGFKQSVMGIPWVALKTKKASARRARWPACVQTGRDRVGTPLSGPGRWPPAVGWLPPADLPWSARDQANLVPVRLWRWLHEYRRRMAHAAARAVRRFGGHW